MSLIHTAELSVADPFEYLTELQRNAGRGLLVGALFPRPVIHPSFIHE